MHVIVHMHYVVFYAYAQLPGSTEREWTIVCSPNTYAYKGIFNPNIPIFPTNSAEGLYFRQDSTVYNNVFSQYSIHYRILYIQPLNSVKGLHLTADNIQYHATFIHSSVYIQDREINVGPGSSFNEKLLEVPIGCCCIGTHASIIITVGLNTTFPNTINSDLHVGVSDGTNSNLWTIVDRNNYPSNPPCAIWFGSGSHDDTRVSSTTPVPVTTKLTFTPFYKYESCEKAQEGGYINTARFNAQLDVTNCLFLQVRRHGPGEQYSIFYFLVEIVNN